MIEIRGETRSVKCFYYIAQVTSAKIAHCDWLLTIMKILIPCEQKQTQNPKRIMFKKFLCLKTKQNTEMSDEEHSDSEFYYPEEQETSKRKAGRRGRHFDKASV